MKIQPTDAEFWNQSIDGVFLSKLDGSSKGGIIIAIYQDLKLPVLYVGTGETLEDIDTFSPQEFVNSLFDNI